MYMEGLYGSLRENQYNTVRWDYANSEQTAMVFISDMDDPVIRDGSTVDMVLDYCHRDKECTISFIVDSRNLGIAFKVTSLNYLFVASSIQRPGTEMTVNKKYHKYRVSQLP